MTYAVVYSSRTGNTELLAQAIRRTLGEQGCVYFGGPEGPVPNADLLFAGFWTNQGTADGPMQEFLKGWDRGPVALFGTAGFGGDAEYFAGILKRVEALLPAGLAVEEGFMCQGRMPSAVRARYQAALEKDPGNPQMQALLENFDRALSHPDETDQEAAAQWARRRISG